MLAFLRERYQIELANLVIEQPPKVEMGEFALPLAFELAKRLRKPSRKIAEEIVAALPLPEGFEKLEVAGAGYINARLKRNLAANALVSGETIGVSDHADEGAANVSGKILVEHTSINPNKAAPVSYTHLDVYKRQGLFNIMQEGDVQIKGYPVRMPLDVALVFSANPEDYTARGKIITPLKDRIGSEIRTHYPATIEEGIAITAQEAWTARSGLQLQLPEFVSQVIEQIAFIAREDKRIDKRSGVSQRLPISATENVISNAERRAIRSGEKLVVPRIGDIYAALPAMTGKLELEYEGELKGADNVVREIIRAAVARTYDKYFHGNSNMNQVVQ